MLTGIAMTPKSRSLEAALTGVPLYKDNPEYSAKVLKVATMAAMHFASKKLTDDGADPSVPGAVDRNGLTVVEVAAINLYSQEAIYNPLNKLLNAKEDRCVCTVCAWVHVLVACCVECKQGHVLPQQSI